MSQMNLSPNPSFESNLSSTTFAGCTNSRVTTVAPGAGNYSAQMVATGGSAMSLSQTISGLTVGARYNASFYFNVTAAASSFVMKATVGAFPGITSGYNAGFWQRAWVAFTATATTATVVIQSTATNTSGDTVLVDRIKVTPGEFMGPYFDGNFPYSSWTGTTNNSTSTCTAFTSNILNTGNWHSEEPIVANGLCLNNLAWNISKNTGILSIPAMRGENTTIPGRRGQTFVKNKPVDVGAFSLQMWVLGCMPDGTMPAYGEMRRLFDYNYNQLVQNIMSTTSVIKFVVWQTDGTARTASGTIGSVVTPEMTAGSRRAELSISFDILEGVWADVLSTSITGTAGAHWSNDIMLLNQLAGGTAPIEDSVITITGPITNPRITDAVSGTWVQYNGTLSSSDSLVIDCGQWTSKLNGVSVLSNTQHYGHNRFLVIDNGGLNRVPQFTMTGTSTGTGTNINVVAARQHWAA